MRIPRLPKEPTYTFRDLSMREVEVLELLAEGLLPKQVAGKLGICAKTVSTHRTHILEKLGIKTDIQLGMRLALYMNSLPTPE